MMAERTMSISDVLGKLRDTAGDTEMSVEAVLSAFGRRAYGPIVFVVGVVSFSPLGAIPGASILFGSLIVILMVQYIARDSAPWVPSWIRERSVPGKQAQQAIDKVTPYFERIETFVRPRYHHLVTVPWTYVVAVICIGLALTMYPLALVPWGVMPPSAALIVFGLGLMSADGLLVGMGIAISFCAFALVLWILAGGGLF